MPTQPVLPLSSNEIPEKAGWLQEARWDGIDLLRGLAIFFVLMNHVNMRLRSVHVPFTEGLPAQLVSSLIWNGQQGVQIFFAISGFLITSTALRRWGSPEKFEIGAFYRIRFARIAPLLLALLALLSCLHFVGLYHSAFSDFVVSARTGGLPRALAAALTFHINWLEAARGYLPASWDILWSLSVEEVFYLFFPIVFRTLGRRRMLFVLLFALVVVGPFARAKAFNPNPVWREYSYLGGMDAIALGCLTALLLSRPAIAERLGGRGLRLLTGLGAALMIFCLCFSETAGRWGLERTGLAMTLLALGACLVIAVAAQTGWRSPRLLAPLRVLGRLSYEVYLTHIFVVLACFYAFIALGKLLWTVPVLFLLVIVGSGLVGAVVARFYSEPMNRRLRAWPGSGSMRHG